MTDLRSSLRVLAEALAPGTAVPVPREVLLELLEANGTAAAAKAIPRADLTVAELAVRYGRKPSTVRGWIERGDFPGAYTFKGREWRVPLVAVEAFEAVRRNGRAVVPTAGQ